MAKLDMKKIRESSMKARYTVNPSSEEILLAEGETKKALIARGEMLMKSIRR